MAPKKKKSPLYADIDDDIRRRVDMLAAAMRRKLNAAVEMALEEFLAKYESTYGLPVESQGPEADPPDTQPPPTPKKRGGKKGGA